MNNEYWAEFVCGGSNLCEDEYGNEYCSASDASIMEQMMCGSEDMCKECYENQ